METQFSDYLSSAIVTDKTVVATTKKVDIKLPQAFVGFIQNAFNGVAGVNNNSNNNNKRGEERFCLFIFTFLTFLKSFEKFLKNVKKMCPQKTRVFQGILCIH